MPHLRCLSGLSVFLGLASAGLALATRVAAAEEDEIATIRQASAAYVQALQNSDRAKLIASWTPGGDYVDATGRRSRAHELIEREFGPMAPNQRGNLRQTVISIRLVSPEAAIEDGSTEHRAEPGHSFPRSRYTAYWVKRDGRWLLDSLRESIVPLPARNSRILELEWLLGEFLGQTNDGTYVVATAVVSPDGNFILRDFLMTHPDGSVQSTSQRIGWDQSTNSFRSWTFDADGSFGEGVWSRHGDNWIVNTTGRTPTGQHKSARNIYQLIADDGFLVASVGSMVGNVMSPDLKVKFERQTPQD